MIFLYFHAKITLTEMSSNSICGISRHRISKMRIGYFVAIGHLQKLILSITISDRERFLGTPQDKISAMYLQARLTRRGAFENSAGTPPCI